MTVTDDSIEHSTRKTAGCSITSVSYMSKSFCPVRKAVACVGGVVTLIILTESSLNSMAVLDSTAG